MNCCNPNCNQGRACPQRKPKKAGFLFALVSAAAFACAVTITKAHAQAKTYTPKVAAIACSKPAHERLTKLVTDGDEAAFTKYAAVALLVGECARLELGTQYYVERESIGVVRVRKAGELTERLTYSEAMNK